MTVEAAAMRRSSPAYLDHVLCPQVESGQVVIMDNLDSHKVAGVRGRIEGVGASLLYLPPYSPELNSIEKGWAKFNQPLRAAKARTAEALDQAIAELLPTIRPQTQQPGSRRATQWHFGFSRSLVSDFVPVRGLKVPSSCRLTLT